MVNDFNKVHPNIQFIIEPEQKNTIDFLDGTVAKKDKFLTFRVYRKPTTTNIIIHNSSFHPLNQKTAAFNGMVHGTVSFPLKPEDLKAEFNIIKHIAISNGFRSTIVDDLLIKNTKKPLIPRLPKESKKYVMVKFNTFALPIANFLRRHNFVAGLSTDNNMLRLLINRSPENIPPENKTGI